MVDQSGIHLRMAHTRWIPGWPGVALCVSVCFVLEEGPSVLFLVLYYFVFLVQECPERPESVSLRVGRGIPLRCTS